MGAETAREQQCRGESRLCGSYAEGKAAAVCVAVMPADGKPSVWQQCRGDQSWVWGGGQGGLGEPPCF
eukprot:2364659-Rhodomonas_salina.1